MLVGRSDPVLRNLLSSMLIVPLIVTHLTLVKFASAPKGPRALRSLLQRESSLFPPNPLPNKILHPPPMSAGVRRRPALWVHFCRKCADLSGPAQPATRLLARPVSPAHPASSPSSRRNQQRSPAARRQGFAALWLRLAAQPATHLSPACPAEAPAHLSTCQPLGPPAGSAQRAKGRFV